MKKKVIQALIACSIFMLIWVFDEINFDQKRHQLIRNKYFTNGYIYRTRPDFYKGHRSTIVFYRFKIGNNQFEENITIDKIKNQYSELELKNFPVISSLQDAENHHLLIFPEDFSTYSLPFPDSLKWVNSLK